MAEHDDTGKVHKTLIYILIVVAGLAHAIPMGLATTYIDAVNSPNTADRMNRAVKPTFIIYISTFALYYIIEGISISLIFVIAYAACMITHLVRKPAIEKKLLRENPRDRQHILSKATSRWLYWLVLPAIAIPVIIAANYANTMGTDPQ